MPICKLNCRRHIALSALTAMLVLSTSGCAFLNRRNTPLLNTVEERLWPKDSGKRALAFPIVFPVGLVAVVTDALIVHPATVIDDAAKDTKDGLWSNMNWSTHYVNECVCLPWRTLLTPPTFVAVFLGRSMFDVPNRADRERRTREKGEQMAESAAAIDKAEALLKAGKADEALRLLGPLMKRWVSPDDRPRLELALLTAAHETQQYEWFEHRRVRQLKAQRQDEAVALLLEGMSRSDQAYARWVAFRARAAAERRKAARTDLLVAALADSSPLVRHLVLSWLTPFTSGSMGKFDRAKAVAALEQVAAHDSEPMNRIIASQLLRKRGRVNGSAR